MNIELDGLRVVVTAGAAGIGLATAELFAANGAHVWVCDIDRAALARLEGTDITSAHADVGDTASIDAFMTAAIAAMGGLDVLVNNAGIAGPGGPVETIDPDEVTHTLDLDVSSMFRTARHAIPVMTAERSGSIVNISSTAGQFGFPNRAAYAAAKWAVIGLTKTMAMELGAFGVRCNAICPGSIDGPRMEHVVDLEAAATGRTPDEVRAGFEGQVSMRTFIDASEIAQAICFLASPLGSRISGQAIAIDGHTETLRVD
ncbi:SDR family oxidoreductase [Ilumatobacter sp.]|uniref:SDR family oxidoreductase n=1 Tax=Ilumatobacter sp. TaxID=1967498 RepID=UPI003AF99963